MRYKDARFDNLDVKVKDTVKQAIADNKGLFIYGGTGTGKTYALHAIARDKSNVDNFVMLLAEFKDSFQRGTYYEKLSDYANQDYVFIDDIGSEKTSEFVIEFLYILINKRYENLKRTVLTTNLSIEDFQARYGDRIVSRLMEMCLFIEMSGEDKRVL